MSAQDMSANRRQVLVTTGSVMLASLVTNTAQAAQRPEKSGSRSATIGRDMPFSEGWLFKRADDASYAQPHIDDAQWRRVDLPHDGSIEDVPGGHEPDQLGPFSKDSIGKSATGWTVGGEGWYRKHFAGHAYPADARLELLFDGCYLQTEVWLNGKSLGQNVHGYIPFAFDLTPHLKRDGDNVLAVRVRNLGQNSRWYAGSGIYREVTLDVMPAGCRLARWGVAAWTRSLSGGRAEIDVTTTVEMAQAGHDLITRLRNAKGTIVAEARTAASAHVSQVLIVRAPELWSPDHPALYTLETELWRGNSRVDRMVQMFGIRIVTFDPQRGMSINGVATKLYGGCIHHDNGLLGARAFADADERRLRLLKERGFNAIRSSHNPASKTLRDACDQLGVLLIEEAFDAWQSPKEPQDFSTQFVDHWQEAIQAMVLSARNSPSVIMWSIGNEIPGRATDEGVHWSWTLANAIKRIDPSRPVTAGLNGVLGQEMIADPQTARPGRGGKPDNASTIFIDVPGYNYRLAHIEREFATHPERVVYASETFPSEVFAYAALTKRIPAFLGEFVWTAMDYIGEAGIGATAQIDQNGPPYYLASWPWVNAWCGDIDLIGQQKAQSLARDVAWGRSKLAVTVQRPVAPGKKEWVSSWGWSDELESWSWPEHQDQPMAIRVYTSADRVELRLNGTKIGENRLQPADAMRTSFELPYAPGLLEVVAYSDGREIARKKLETVGAAAGLRLNVEGGAHGGDRQSLGFVGIDVLDSKGRVPPDERRPVSLKIDGPAELVAFGSANPYAVGSLQAARAQTFRGRALAVVRRRGAGLVRISATSDGLTPAATTLRFT